MAKSLTIKDIDLLIKDFSSGRSTNRQILLKSIRSYYKNNLDFKKIKSIKTEDLILKIWPIDVKELKIKKAHIKEKRKSLSSLKTQINNKCRDLFWENKNIARVGIGRFNTFKVLKETKYEEVKKLKSEVEYLQTIINDVAPGALSKLNKAENIEMLDIIREAAAKHVIKDVSEEKLSLFAHDFQMEEDKKGAPTEKEVETSQKTLKVKDQISVLIEEINKLNLEALDINNKIASGEITSKEGKKLLDTILNKKCNLQNSAQTLINKLNEIESEIDPFLKTSVEKLKTLLGDFTADKKITSAEELEKLLKAGISAETDFEKAESIDTQDDIIFKDKEKIEKDFQKLKNQAKNILIQFKTIQPAIKSLIDKSKADFELSEDDDKKLKQLKIEFQKLQSEGEEILLKLLEIEKASKGAIHEACKLIISALERFIQKKEKQKEVLMLVEKGRKLAEDLKEGEKNLSAFSNRIWKRIVSSNPDELKGLHDEYEKIQSEISNAKEQVEKAKEEKEKITQEIKAEREKDLKEEELQKELKVVEGESPPTVKDIENSKLVLDAREQALKLAEKLDDLNKQSEDLERKIKDNEISEEDGKILLNEINEEKRKTEVLAKKLSDTLKDIETGGDPLLDGALDKLKGFIKDWIEDKGITDFNMLEGMIEESIKALNEFEEALSKESHDETVFENKEELEKEFTDLKGKAKTILTKFKKIQPEIESLISKNKTDSLSDSEGDKLTTIQREYKALKKEGEIILGKFSNIEQQAEGAIKEACKLIISALQRFIGKEEKADEMLVVVDKNKNFASQLKESEENLAIFSKRIWKKIASAKPDELKDLHEEYEKIQTDISNTKAAIDTAKDEKEKLINNLQMERQLKEDELEKEIKIIEGEAPPTSQEIENSNLVLNAREQAIKLSEKLESLNRKAKKLEEDISEGKIDENEGKSILKGILDEKKKTEMLAGKLSETLKDIDEGGDPLLDAALKKFKGVLKNWIEDKKITDLDTLDEKLEDSLKALDDFEKQVDKDTKDETIFENKEEIEKQFNELKLKAKSLIIDFKGIHPKIKSLVAKSKNEKGIKPEENQELESLQSRYSALKDEGEKILDKLISIEKQSQGAIQEACRLIISALERFIGSKKTKDEILMFMGKNRQLAEQLVETEEDLSEFSNKIWKRLAASSTPEGEEYGDLTLKDKLSFAKTDTQRLALQLDMLLKESSKKEVGPEAEKEAKTEEEQEFAVGAGIEPQADEIKDKNGTGTKEEIVEAKELSQSLERIKNKGDKVFAKILDTSNKADQEIEADLDKETTIDMILLLKSETKKLSEELKTINEEYERLQKELEKNKISLEAAEKEIKELQDRRTSLQEQAKKLNKDITELEHKIEDIDDQKLSNATKIIKESLQKLIEEKGLTEEDIINAARKGVQAIEDFTKAEKKLEEMGEAGTEKLKELKEKFTGLKDQAKELIKKFKTIDNKIGLLDKPEKTEEDSLLVEQMNNERRDLENKGKVIIKGMEQILRQSEGPLKEAAMLIISSLKRFIKDMILISQDKTKDLSDEKVIVLGLEKGEKSLDEVVEEIKKRAPEKEVEVSEEVDLKDLNKDAIQKSKKDLDALKNNLKELVEYLAGIDAKYFPYNTELEEHDKEILKKIDLEHRKFEKQAESISDEIDKLLMKIGIERPKKDKVMSSGLDLLKKGMKNIQNENIWEAMMDINQAMDIFDKTGENVDGLSEKMGSNEPQAFFIPPSKQAAIGAMSEIMGAFYIDKFPVTLSNFRKFVEVTGYQTYAERLGFGWVVEKSGWIRIIEGKQTISSYQNASLKKIPNASWYSPEGEKKHIMDIVDSMHHPVVQVTYEDAMAFAKWKGKRLPTVEEWMLAAFGKENIKYPWGNDADKTKCNHQKSDFINISPVDQYDPNSLGVYDMVGNIWEWCEGETLREKNLLGGCWNLDLNKMGRALKQVVSPLEFSNTIGFRCVKNK